MPNKDEEWLTCEYINVKNVKELKDALNLIPDNTKFEMQLRLVIELKTNQHFLQFRKPEIY